MVSVYITVDSTIHPQSQPFTIGICARQDTTTTGAWLLYVYITTNSIFIL